MRKALKWMGIALGLFFGGLGLLIAGLYLSATSRMGRTYEVQSGAVAIPSDPASVQVGEQWVNALCAGCHGEDLSGAVMFEDPSIGRVVAPNLTAGEGGVGGAYTDADWVRAIRHGIGPEGKALFVMPSEAYYYFSDRDLGAIIAYLKILGPVDNEPGGISVTPMARLLVAAGVFVNPFAAERIDHDAPRPVSPPPGVTVEYGEYLSLVLGCPSCHGPDLAGGKHPDPNGPPGPNITTAGSLAVWSEEDFIDAVRTRKSRWMPWEELNGLPDEALKALWQYLKSVPGAE